MNKNSVRESAFTLIELLVVISIIGILIALSIFGLQGARTASRDARRKADLEQIRSALEIYKSDCSKYPDALDWGGTLVGGVTPPLASCSSDNTYMAQVPNDPLAPNQGYTYSKSDDTHYSLCATLEQTAASYCVSNP